MTQSTRKRMMTLNFKPKSANETSNRIPKVFVLAEFFSPAWRAGGMPEAIKNLYQHFSTNGLIEFFIYCRSVDIDGAKLDVVEDTWLKIERGWVMYSSELKDFYSLKKTIETVSPDFVYVNGMFSKHFTFHPLATLKFLSIKNVTLVIAPHGMLHQNALKISKYKKIIFLALLKTLGLLKNAHWHATDEQEALDIRKVISPFTKVSIVPNLPKMPLGTITNADKIPNSLHLVFLSLISEKKNLLFALKLLKKWDKPVSFDIYGPIKNIAYWKQCQDYIHQLPKHINVQYKGEVEPHTVQKIFTKYDALFLPTQGENFGYAIYECMSVGRPVIISTQTPWQNLLHHNAGYDVELNDTEGYINALNTFFKMSGSEYYEFQKGAHNIALSYLEKNDFDKSYTQLFSLIRN